MKLEIPVKVDFDDVQAMIYELKKLQTYKLFEGDDTVLVELDDVISILAKHIRETHNSSESPNSWILVSERLPRAEQEVLICTKKKHYESKRGMDYWEESIITPAIYEDGTVLEVDSTWNWYDIDWAGWDEEEDCGIIPEGWWENRHFNPDEVYNNPVDKEVIAWMPLPEPWKGG